MRKLCPLVVVVLGLSIPGCLGPEPAASTRAADEAALVADDAAQVDQNALPDGLTPEELCEMMCQTMGGLGGELCRAMHAAGFDMTGTMHPELQPPNPTPQPQ